MSHFPAEPRASPGAELWRKSTDWRLVARKIHHDTEHGDEDMGDIGKERTGVHRAIEHSACDIIVAHAFR